MNVAFCDGGLCNRLNVLIFALALKARYGHPWQIGWPQNNWCGAALDRLFEVDAPVSGDSLASYGSEPDRFHYLVHENQAAFPTGHLTLQSQIGGFADLESLLAGERELFYYHNLLPAFADLADFQLGLRQMRINADVFRTATDFCTAHQIDGEVLGLHIRKTDFGDAVDDKGLFDLVSHSPKRFFVCSDSEEVNTRFAALPNCSVFPKTSFPQKLLVDGGWNAMTTDDQGRAFTFNITRPEDSIIEALVDLLILSRTLHVKTSHSTFLNMAMIFKGTGFFQP